jgi:hypothetical protein
MTCLVICKGDYGDYVLATRTLFESRELAQEYVTGVAPSRDPIIVECPLGADLLPLRQSHPELYQTYMERIRQRQ